MKSLQILPIGQVTLIQFAVDETCHYDKLRRAPPLRYNFEYVNP